jgi:tetratricopeptide (TPR) repeat protein
LGLHTAYLEKYEVGASGEEWNFSYLERLLIAGRAAWFYVGKLAWPAQLTFIYPRWQVSAASWWQYGFPLAALAVLLVLYGLRGRLGRGPLTAALFFGGTLVPALGFFNLYPMRFSFVADHFQYLASAGLLALAAAGLREALTRGSACRRPVRWGLCGLLVVALGGLTWQQVGVYHDRITLWTDTLTKNPDCWAAYFNRARLYDQRGQWSQAVRDYDRAIELRPDLADAYLNRGAVYQQSGQLREAVRDYTRAIELEPEHAAAYANRAAVYNRLGQPEDAIRDYTRAIELQPDLADLYAHRGAICLQQGQLPETVRDCTRALELQPDSAMAYGTRGTAYHLLGQAPLALDDLTRAIELRPELGPAYTSRGVLYHQLGQGEQAVRDFSRAIQLNPDAAGAYFNRAQAYCGLKQYEEAWRDVKRGQQHGGTPDPTFLQHLIESSGQSD